MFMHNANFISAQSESVGEVGQDEKKKKKKKDEKEEDEIKIEIQKWRREKNFCKCFS
jgi:hypothetical protein